MVVIMVAVTVVMPAVGIMLMRATFLPTTEDNKEKRRQQDEGEKDYDFHNSKIQPHSTLTIRGCRG